MALSREDPEGLVAALSHENMFWRMTAQRLLVQRDETDVVPELCRLVNHKTKDELGMNPGATHALWTLHGLGLMDGSNDEAYRVAVAALRHPAAGVRKTALEVLPRAPWANQAILQTSLLQDSDPHTRLAAILALAEMEPSAKLGEKLYRLSLEPSVQKDDWLTKAVYCAAAQHQEGYTNAFLADHPDYESMRAELANRPTPEATAFDDKAWQTIQLPQYLEQAGLHIDGIVWFRKYVNIPASMTGKPASIHLGTINESDETWINGVRVGATQDAPDKERTYDVPAGTLKPGRNLIAVQIEDQRGWGGFSGEPEQLFVQAGNQQVSLASQWKYAVTEAYRGENIIMDEEATIADLFMENYWGTDEPVAEADVEETKSDANTAVITIKTVKNAMKYDLTEFAVKAGQSVEIVFENSDFMQHNLLIVQEGALETVGAAADQLATAPDGAEQNYIPDVPEVLHATALVDPGNTVTLTFTAPEEPGEYPFVCTFPGHWRIMQGTMKVVPSTESI